MLEPTDKECKPKVFKLELSDSSEYITFCDIEGFFYEIAFNKPTQSISAKELLSEKLINDAKLFKSLIRDKYDLVNLVKIKSKMCCKFSFSKTPMLVNFDHVAISNFITSSTPPH